MARRPRMLWGVHLAYFGLYVLGAILIQASPELHTMLLSAVKGELSKSGKGPLALAGKAYGSGNMLYAALVTFAINFPLGSFVMITLPSMIIPGSGALLAIFRTLWGVLLGRRWSRSHGRCFLTPARFARGRGLYSGHLLRPAHSCLSLQFEPEAQRADRARRAGAANDQSSARWKSSHPSLASFRTPSWRHLRHGVTRS